MYYIPMYYIRCILFYVIDKKYSIGYIKWNISTVIYKCAKKWGKGRSPFFFSPPFEGGQGGR